MESPDIGSERDYFTMHGNAEGFADVKYVFCDELEEYTFYPYKGKLKAAQEYCEDGEDFENSQIFIENNITGKIVKVPCNIVEQSKQVYLSEDNFNKYWRMISENICRSICKRGRTDVTQPAMNEKVNLFLLENAARTAKINDAFKIEYKGKEIDIEAQRLISRRANALEDSRIRFVYAKNDNFVHDKSCKQVEKIKYWNFGAAEKLPEGRELCPCCKRQIYIRNAIKTNTKRFLWYIHFFKKGRVSTKAIEKYLGSGNAELHMYSVNELQIKYGEDTWIIQMDKEGSCTLRHNNYVMVNERERYITSGFHAQNHCPTYLTGVLAYIAGYDWKKHLEAKENTRKDTAQWEVEYQEKPARKSLLCWIKSLFEKRKR